MAIKVIMPQMGESVLEGTVTKWLKKVGEGVKQDEPLFEVSTDKVDTEIVSPADGMLSQILVPEGQTVGVFTVVAVIESQVTAPPAAAPEEAVSAAGAGNTGAMPPSGAETAAEAAPEAAEMVRTSPLVRRIAKEHGIDLARIRGTGLAGRITRADLQKHLPAPETGAAPSPGEQGAAVPPKPPVAAKAEPAQMEAPAGPAPIPAAAPLSPAAPEASSGDFEIVAMTPMRKAIAEHMILSRRTSAHVQTVFEVDMTTLVQLREKRGEEFEKRYGIKLTLTPFFVKALVDVVREFPILNSSVSGDQIVFKKPVNVGIAVALESGLIVPVVRDAHQKSFADLALAVHDLASRARDKKLKPEEVQHGTITVTNPGAFGALFGTPIINQPQVAILGVGTLEKRPVVIHDAIAIRTMVYLVLSFDHRVIDGAVADKAMSSLKLRLQAWDRL